MAAETPKQAILTREYVIPLRRAWLNVPAYRRAGKAVKTIKIFLAKHMKVPGRDTRLVKLDVLFNNEVWYRGKNNPPSKVKVKAVKEGDVVHVTFAQMPQHVAYNKAKLENRQKKAEKKEEKTPTKAAPAEEKKETTPEQKKNEAEKEIAGEQQNIKEAKTEAKVEQHLHKPDKATHPQRMALKK